MLRGKLWDDVTFGAARRRRSMLRRLAELDRLDRAGGSAAVGRGDASRRFLVGLTTTAVIATATVVALDRQLGIEVDLDGFHRRTALGAPPDVATGVGTFRFMSHQRGRPGEPVAYDPCRPVEIVVNGRQAPAGAGGLVEEAVAEVSAATGLRMTIVGATDEPASADRPGEDPGRYGRGWSPVIVGWTSPSEVPDLAGDVAGVGGSIEWAVSMTAPRRFVTGAVWLDAPQLRGALGRPEGRAQVRAIILHELAHLVGLGHVDDPQELMYAENVGLPDFGPGDREGLARLGRGSCA